MNDQMLDSESKPNQESRPVGRPSKYKPEYCEEFQNLSAQGLTALSIAEEFDVHTDTLQEWRKVHPEFSVAYTRGAQKRSNYYMRLAQDNLSNKDFNFNMFRWMTKFVCDKKHLGHTVYVPGMAEEEDDLKKIRLAVKAMANELITPDEARAVIDTITAGCTTILNMQEFKEVMMEMKKQMEALQMK